MWRVLLSRKQADLASSGKLLIALKLDETDVPCVLSHCLARD